MAIDSRWFMRFYTQSIYGLAWVYVLQALVVYFQQGRYAN